MFSSFSTGVIAPGVHFLRVDKAMELYRGVKAHYGLSLTCSGRSVSRVDGRERVEEAGTLGLTQPGQVHSNIRRDAPGAFQFVSFDSRLVEEAQSALDQRLSGRLAADLVSPLDVSARPFRRLHLMVLSGMKDRFALDVAVAETLTTFTSFLSPTRAGATANLGPSVRRARAFLLDHFAEGVSLEDLAEHARTDKFHLCRAFSRELGLPPYAFLTEVRVARAKILLRDGVRASDIAPLVGYNDQSQLHRHFVRIVGCTPGAYARS